MIIIVNITIQQEKPMLMIYYKDIYVSKVVLKIRCSTHRVEFVI